MEKQKLKVGDLVYYRSREPNRYANGEDQLGVVLEIRTDANPLFALHPETKPFASEYVVEWFKTGYRCTLLRFNLKKVKLPVDNLL